nr:MAG: replication associated protein [Cressdnaviricota sp.]
MEEVYEDRSSGDESEEAKPPEPKKPKAKVRAPTHRNLCFTINAKEGVDLRLLDFTHPTWTNVRYCVYQREMADHEHFQGYIEFTSQKSFDAVHAMEGMERAHLEPRRGNAKQADHYCRKPVVGCLCNQCSEELAHPTYLEGPWEFGVMSHQGQRADLMEIQRELNKGVSLKRIALEFFPEWVRFGKAFKDYKRIIAEPRDFKPLVILVVGPSGKGKSRFAHRLAHYLSPPDEDYYIVPEKTTGTCWMDDYDQNRVFFMDEMDGSRMRPTFFNGLVDRYPFVVPAHGGAGSHMNARIMIFVSNYLPKFWWKNRSPDQIKQTMRRIDLVWPMFKREQGYVHKAWGVFEPADWNEPMEYSSDEGFPNDEVNE